MDIFSPNFVCVLILTRSRLGLLPVIFRNYVKRGMNIDLSCQIFVSAV